MTVVGTRPEIIRLSRVIAHLDETVEHTLVHTGQNWDPNLRDVFFDDLDLKPPARDLGVDVSSLGRVLGDTISKVEPLIREIRPEAFVVLGDTNSCLAAIMAKRLRVPVFHLEAGNRCFDENVPEEVNRRLIDHLADFNLCYTEHARRNLLAEGLHPRRTFVIGSPMYEVLRAYRSKIDTSDVVSRLGLDPGGYLVVSTHREENVDNPANLAALVEAITSLQKAMGVRVIVTTHPRLRNRLAVLGGEVDTSGLELLEPLGYLDYIRLQEQARCVISDSGTISEESSMLGFPAVTIRNAMERPEALDAGAIVLTGLTSERIERAVRLVVDAAASGFRPSLPPEYQVPDTSRRVVRLIVGLSGVYRRWSGLDATMLSLLPE